MDRLKAVLQAMGLGCLAAMAFGAVLGTLVYWMSPYSVAMPHDYWLGSIALFCLFSMPTAPLWCYLLYRFNPKIRDTMDGRPREIAPKEQVRIET